MRHRHVKRKKKKKKARKQDWESRGLLRITGKILASAVTGQRGADDGALVKKEACRYKRGKTLSRKGSVARFASNNGVCTLPCHFLLFLHIHSCTLHFYQVRQNTHHCQKEALLWPLRHHPIYQTERRSMKDKINNSRCNSGRLTRGSRITI